MSIQGPGLSVTNVKGRPFTCINTHGVPGYSNISNVGETGILHEYNPNTNRVRARLWRNDTYIQVVLKVEYLNIGWPPTLPGIVDFPFRCAETYTNSSGLQVNFLDEGSIVAYDDKTKKAKVSIPKRNLRVWVDPRYLHIGTERKYGDIVVDTGLRSTLTADATSTELNANDYPVTELLFPLVCSIMNQQGSLTWLPSFLGTLLPNRAAALNLARRIGDGVQRAGLTQAFSRTHPWSWREIVNRGNKIDGTTPGEGIYGRFYSDFKQNTELEGKKPRVYIGKTTVSFGSRDRGHQDSTDNPDNPDYHGGHYQIARQAKSRQRVVLAYLDNFSESEIAVAEQSMVLIFRSYRPEVLNWVPIVRAGQAVPATANNTAHAEAEVIATLEDKEPATQLTQLAEDLFKRLGWDDHFGTSGGCNKQSPLGGFGSYEKVLWTLIQYPDRDVYYRSPYRSFKGAGGHVMFQKNCHTAKGNKTVFAINRREDHPKPPKGKSIYFSVEIMHRGRHTHAYSRMPDFGIWNNWDDINQMALRTRWSGEDSGDKWHSFYLQMEKDELAIQNPAEPGSIGVHMDLTNFRMYLERTMMPTPLAWFDKWGTARVKQLKFDHLSQAIRIIDPPAPNPVNLPTPLRDEQTLIANYAARGLTNYGVVSTNPLVKALLGRNRTACDACFLCSHRNRYYPGKVSASKKKCELAAGDTTCMFCLFWGHKCTFTKTDVLERNVQTLIWYPPRPWVTDRIPDPGFELHALAN